MTLVPNVHEPIPAEVRDTPVVGLRLASRTLGEELSGATRLLVFLRHFG